MNLIFPVISVTLAALSLSSSSYAAKCCNTPTIWTFKNTSQNSVTLNCTLDSSSAILAAPVSLATGPIAAKGSYEHNWGPNWDNEGMGLVPGKWTCRNIESKGRAANSTVVKFITDWGENVVVTWKDSEPSVAKVDPVKPVPADKSKKIN